MSVQITTLIAALLGGLLTGLGSLISNYYVQSASMKAEKQKTVKDKVESIYKELQLIEDSYDRSFELLKEESNLVVIDYDPFVAMDHQSDLEGNIVGIASDIKTRLKIMNLLITLYLSPLQNNFKKYEQRINKIVKPLEEGCEDIKSLFPKEDLENANREFETSLLTLFRKKGYGYL